MIRKYTGVEPEFEFTSGGEYPDRVTDYSLVVHCGGCMLNGREMAWRMKNTDGENVPFTNYGVAIAYMNGILKRALSVFPDFKKTVDLMR